MQRPPPTPPILLTRPAHDWIGKVDQRKAAFIRLKSSSEQQEAVHNRIESEFTRSVLALAANSSSESEVFQLESGSRERASASPPASRIVAGFRLIEEESTRGRDAALTPELLARLNALVTGEEAGLRRATEPVGAYSSRAMPPKSLPLAIDTACAWYAAPSFSELHAIEQAAIALLRLLELWPFEKGTEATSLVAASLFTLRSGFPPVIIRPNQISLYQAALKEGLLMNTKAMVELIAESVDKTLRDLIGVLDGE
jgi:Fic/DOC family protein